jgi:hypothetical protein
MGAFLSSWYAVHPLYLSSCYVIVLAFASLHDAAFITISRQPPGDRIAGSHTKTRRAADSVILIIPRENTVALSRNDHSATAGCLELETLRWLRVRCMIERTALCSTSLYDPKRVNVDIHPRLKSHPYAHGRRQMAIRKQGLDL